MQNFNVYLRAASVKAAAVDQFNNTISEKVSLTRGMQAELVLHLFHTAEETSLFTAGDLAAFVSWAWCADSDYDLTTAPKLRVQTGITVDTDGAIHIPITETNTEEIAAYLGTAESKDLKTELVGLISGETKPNFVLQFDISIRNRIGNEGTGQPTPVGDSAYTAAQVDALFAASNTVQYSSDGETWSSAYSSGATQRRYKNSAITGAEWTVETLATGPAGADGSNGKTNYLYVGFAADISGADFSLSAAGSRKYRAEFHNTTFISAPVLSDFTSAGATWVKFIGEDGSSGAAGTGDMSTSDFVSSGGAGVVISAASAGKAGAVEWDNITSRPEQARQIVSAGSNTLMLEANIISCGSNIAAGALQIDFPHITKGGSAYTGSAGDVFTWEYHVKATAAIGTVTVGSSSTITKIDAESFPQDLPLIANAATIHVFTIRGRYQSGAVNNIKLLVNHAYSEEA